MDRVLQGTTATIGVTFQVDGNPTDPTPTDVTVHVTRGDGTDLIPAGTAANRTGTGVYTYNLQTTHTALLDNLTVTWTSQNLGVLSTEAEIVGGYLFTLAQMRAFAGGAFSDPARFSTAELITTRTDVEIALERELGYALVPRYQRDTVTTGRYIRLQPYVRAIRSVTSAGTVVDATSWEYGAAGYINQTARWPTVVEYEHGLDANSDTTRRMQRPGLMLAKAWLTDSPVDDRAATFSSVDGGTYSLVTPGRGGSIFGEPTVDAAVKAERLPSIA